MDDIAYGDRQKRVQTDTVNLTFEAPNRVDQDINISYIEIKPLSFNTDVDVVDKCQSYKSEDTYQNRPTVANASEELAGTSQHRITTLKDERKTNLLIEGRNSEEIKSSIQTRGDWECDIETTSSGEPLASLTYPRIHQFKVESLLDESEYLGSGIQDQTIKSESSISDLQTTTTTPGDMTPYNVKLEQSPSTYPDLQTISDNSKLVRMSGLDPMNEDLHENIEPECAQNTSCNVSATDSITYNCDATCTEKGTQSMQVQTQAGSELYKCQHCDAIYSRKDHLVRHVRTHTDKPYKCEHCDARFSHKCNLVSHVRTHTGIKPYKCQHCDAAFTQKGALVNHERIHSGIKPYKCEHCNARFIRKDQIMSHLPTHTGIKPYKCDLCDARFTRKDSLVKHERIHTGVKPYKCELCDARFTQKVSLVRHAWKHTGSKPYTCPHCPATFAHKPSLVAHLPIHTGIKPYKCDLCDARFTRKDSLVKHDRIHTGIKPYKCEHCDARFTSKSNLLVHIRKHTGSKPYKCQQCDAKFKRKESLLKHNNIHTGNK